jgi:hypothetical protein
MKSKLTTLLLALTATLVSGHGDVEIGPNGGRILEFSKNETIHGEVTLKGDKFHIAVLDKEMKPLAVTEQTLTANGGPVGKAQKLTVEKTAKGFVVPAVKPGEWLIVQFKENPKAKPVTARLEFNTSKCPTCSSLEWLCKCHNEEAKKDAKKGKK